MKSEPLSGQLGITSSLFTWSNVVDVPPIRLVPDIQQLVVRRPARHQHRRVVSSCHLQQHSFSQTAGKNQQIRCCLCCLSTGSKVSIWSLVVPLWNWQVLWVSELRAQCGACTGNWIPCEHYCRWWQTQSHSCPQSTPPLCPTAARSSKVNPLALVKGSLAFLAFSCSDTSSERVSSEVSKVDSFCEVERRCTYQWNWQQERWRKPKQQTMFGWSHWTHAIRFPSGDTRGLE